MINTGPTAKLINELKAENCNLLSRLSGLGNSGRPVEDETSTYYEVKNISFADIEFRTVILPFVLLRDYTRLNIWMQ